MRQTWYTPDPHPCLGECGTILQHPWAKRCPKCGRIRAAEKVRVLYRKRRERGVCVKCGKVPAFRGGLCEPHWERNREHKRKSQAERRWRNQKFVNCEICGIKIKKISQTKYCRPCSVITWYEPKFVNCEICGIKIKKISQTKYCRPCSVGAWHDRIYNERKREGLCAKCGKVPAIENRVCCEECLAKKLGTRWRIHNERKREGLCTHCGKVPKGKTQTCEKCRRDLKVKNLRREIRKG